MTIHIIRTRATPEQMAEMQQMLHTYIKLAVDVERKILAGGAKCTPTVKMLCWMMAAGKKMFGEQIGVRSNRK